MTAPVEISLPARPEWDLVARSVVLAFASAQGVPSSYLGELGMVCGQIWGEVADAPGVTNAAIVVSHSGDAIHLEITGTGEGPFPHEPGTWSSQVARAVVGHLSRTVSVTRSGDSVRIQAEIAIAGT